MTRKHLWLVLGAALLALTHFRFGIGVLAWLAPIPFLHHTRLSSGWRSRAALMAASLFGWIAAVSKIVTDPLPLAFAVLFALPVGVLLTLPYLAVPAIRRRLGERTAIVAFAALMVVGEWTLHAALPFGTWGAAAHTQLEHLSLMQLASVTGVHGVSFLVYLVAASLELAFAKPKRVMPLLASVGLVVGITAVGAGRLAVASASASDHVRVAAVGTDSRIGVGALPDADEIAAVEHGLFERTRIAARAGAALVVWTEGAHLVYPEEEEAFLARAGALAHELGVTVVVGYIVPLSLDPLRYRNRYALLTASGAVHHTYDKHHPVPGEPATAGRAPLPVYTHPELGRVSGALCYDYDFPRLALEHAQLHVDLVALPSSDWRGIDPIHTEMAAVRAIEGGHSVVRSTRWGLSAGVDPHGRLRGWLSHHDDTQRVLIVNLPRHGVTTFYGLAGDWFPLACGVLALVVLVASVKRQRRWYASEPCPHPSYPLPAAPCSTPASDSGTTSTAS